MTGGVAEQLRDRILSHRSKKIPEQGSSGPAIVRSLQRYTPALRLAFLGPADAFRKKLMRLGNKYYYRSQARTIKTILFRRPDYREPAKAFYARFYAPLFFFFLRSNDRSWNSAAEQLAAVPCVKVARLPAHPGLVETLLFF